MYRLPKQFPLKKPPATVEETTLEETTLEDTQTAMEENTAIVNVAANIEDIDVNEILTVD